MNNKVCDDCYYSKLCPVNDRYKFGCRDFIRLSDLIAESFRALDRFCNDHGRCSNCDLVDSCPVVNAELKTPELLASLIAPKFDPSTIERG